ncbi:MAG: DUF3431 domain-containing protein [Alphaproteobacteria bacterium]|nr:DUF3431 domain-containing protein [Alphaproteobacteria bacterium]
MGDSATGQNFFCISFYDGTNDLLKYTGGNHRIYFKGEENRAAFEAFDAGQKQHIPNIGYNLYAYLKFIVDNYDTLPDVVVFCKNSIYPRHMREAEFARLCGRQVFTPLVDRTYWNRLAFPVSAICSDDGYLEINDSHYSRGRTGRYFSHFNDFFDFVFDGEARPDYLKFAPGANYVVPKVNIRLRSRAFYQNLLTLIAYEPLALECYFVERALEIIWTSAVAEAAIMSTPLDDKTLEDLQTHSARKASYIRLAGTKAAYAITNFLSKYWQHT